MCHFLISLRGRQNKPGPTQLAGDLSYALALRDTLILVDRDVWTVCGNSSADKDNCHVALALPGLADSNLARRIGGYLPAAALYRGKNMNAHATCRWRCRHSYSSTHCHALWLPSPPLFTPSFPSPISYLYLLLSLSGVKLAHIGWWICYAKMLLIE